MLDSDGARGRGHAELTRDAKGAHVRGVVLPGVDATLDAAEIDSTAMLAVRHFLAGKLLLLPMLAKLSVGESSELHDGELAVGSTIAAEGDSGEWTAAAINAPRLVPARLRLMRSTACNVCSSLARNAAGSRAGRPRISLIEPSSPPSTGPSVKPTPKAKPISIIPELRPSGVVLRGDRHRVVVAECRPGRFQLGRGLAR